MADVERPFPPGDYPLVVVGSGPAGLQVSYFLRHLGVEHAVISRDEGPGGMFRRYPLFDRLISWTKPNAPVAPDTREYERYDWNSLLVTDPHERVPVASFMDGSSEFPSRTEMASSLTAFAERQGVPVRYGCTWEGTRREGDRFVLETSDGEYRCSVAVFAIGMAEPWKPRTIPGVESALHYMELKAPDEYRGKRVYILGKATSAFEVADGLLPLARTIVLSSPHEARLSVVERSLAGLRARYLQPMEDHAVGGGGVLVFDAATERIERAGSGFVVSLKGTTAPWDLDLEFDEVVVATGVSTPMLDLPDIGVATYFRGGRLPAQTPFWESATVPGIYFAGSNNQGNPGLRGSTGAGAVHGFRYNARILASHIAETRFGVRMDRPTIRPDEVVPLLLHEMTAGPEVWTQRSYLGRVISFLPDRGVVDDGILPLAYFADSGGPDAVAVGVAQDEARDLRGAVYVRREGHVTEHLLQGSPVLDFTTPDHHAELRSVLKGLLP